MRSIGNDIKSTNVDSSSSITQTHIDEAGAASDSRAAVLIAPQATYELGLRVTAKAAADAAQTIEINDTTTTAITTAHTEIAADGYFDKIITIDATISNMGYTFATGFAHKDLATSGLYAYYKQMREEHILIQQLGCQLNLDVITPPQ